MVLSYFLSTLPNKAICIVRTLQTKHTHTFLLLNPKAHPIAAAGNKEKGARNTHQWDSLKRIPSLPRASFAQTNKGKGSSKLGLFPYLFVRKEWDSNPRYTKKRTPDFESGPFDHSGIFPLLQQCKCNKKKQHKNKKLFKFISLKFI